MIDPEGARYRRNYPAFPGVEKAVNLLRQPNVQGAYLEAVLHDLEQYAIEHPDELALAFQEEQNDRVRILLLSILAEVAAPTTLPLFTENLQAGDESLRYWAMVGLHELGTKEARRILWEARAYIRETPQATEAFQRELALVTSRPRRKTSSHV